jgi:hypothetical protein
LQHLLHPSGHRLAVFDLAQDPDLHVVDQQREMLGVASVLQRPRNLETLNVLHRPASLQDSVERRLRRPQRDPTGLSRRRTMPSTMIDRGASTSEEGFIPGLGRLRTRLYDPVVRLTTRERRFKERLLELADLRPGERALDLGCGTGTLAIAACRRQPGASVHGLDADPRMIERARRKAHAAGVGLELRQGAATELPYADGSFDVVLSSLLFHHLDRARSTPPPERWPECWSAAGASWSPIGAGPPTR